MIKRNYFMYAKCTDLSGYCYRSTISSYSSIFPDSVFVFDDMSKKFKQELLSIRPSGNVEIIAFNRV